MHEQTLIPRGFLGSWKSEDLSIPERPNMQRMIDTGRAEEIERLKQTNNDAGQKFHINPS